MGAIVAGSLGMLPAGPKYLAKAAGGLDVVFNLMASSVMLYNDLMLIFLKQTAKECVKYLDEKLKYNAEFKELLTKLYTLLSSLSAGDPVFDKYLADLRAALVLLDTGTFDIRLVRNTLEASDTFLAERFKKGQQSIVDAQVAIRPLKDNKYLQVTAEGLGKNLGVPTSGEQIMNMMEVPALCKELIDVSTGYMRSTLAANSCLVAYFLGLDNLKTGMPAIIKKYTLRVFDQILDRLTDVGDNMAIVLNGSSSAKRAPVGGFEPVPLKVFAHSYKWVRELGILVPLLRTVPVSGLSQFNLSEGPVNAYRASIAAIKRLNTVATPKAVLISKDGQEDALLFTGQLTRLLAEAAAGMVAARFAKSSLSVLRSFIYRNDLAIAQTTQVKSALQSFIDTPIPLEDTLKKLMESIMKVLKMLGLDGAADALKSGDYAKFFGMGTKDASYLGAALVALSFLKQCFPNPADAEKLEDAQGELQGRQDLLNVSVNFNFDFAIFKNLDDCIKLTEKAKLFLNKQNLCALLQKGASKITSTAAYGKLTQSMSKLKAAVSF
jgi:hypothetical protein